MPLFCRRHIVGMLLTVIVASAGLAMGSGGGRSTARAVTIVCAATTAPDVAEGASPTAGDPTPPVFPDGGGELTVFAAASLAGSFNQIKNVLELANPGLLITYNFAGSQALVTQLTEGSPADVVALASPLQMDAAVKAGIVDGPAEVFARNELAIVAPVDNPAGVRTAADLGKKRLKLVIAAADVPAGQYARESVCNMGSDPATYGDGFVDAVAANIVSEEDSVTAVLAKIQLGEADAGIVYTTDVTDRLTADVHVVEIPAGVNVVASYPIAMTMDGDAELAAGFISFVLGQQGQAILETYGFKSKP